MTRLICGCPLGLKGFKYSPLIKNIVYLKVYTILSFILSFVLIYRCLFRYLFSAASLAFTASWKLSDVPRYNLCITPIIVYWYCNYNRTPQVKRLGIENLLMISEGRQIVTINPSERIIIV